MMTAGLSSRRSLPGRSGRWGLTSINLICPWCLVLPSELGLNQACCHAIIPIDVNCCWQPELKLQGNPCQEAPETNACPLSWVVHRASPHKLRIPLCRGLSMIAWCDLLLHPHICYESRAASFGTLPLQVFASQRT